MTKPVAEAASGELFNELMTETSRLNGLLVAGEHQLAKDLRLSNAHWQVLTTIDETPLSMAQIARRLGVTRQGVRRTADALGRRELIAFQDNPDHRRAKLVAMTDYGRSVLGRAKKRQMDWCDRIAKNFSSQEIVAATRMMRALCAGLGDGDVPGKGEG